MTLSESSGSHKKRRNRPRVFGSTRMQAEQARVSQTTVVRMQYLQRWCPELMDDIPSLGVRGTVARITRLAQHRETLAAFRIMDLEDASIDGGVDTG